MARFGLDSDSDEESVHSLPPANGAASTSSSRSESDNDEAPPRQSLAQSDDETMDDSDEQTIQEDDDDESESESFDEPSVVEDSFSHTERARRAGTESTYGPPSVDEDDDDEHMSSSGSASDSGSEFSRAVGGLRESSVPVGGQAQQAWAKTLGLEPKRVAVMQASFFHQQETGSAASPAKKHPRASAAPYNPFSQPQQSQAAPAPAAVARPNFSAPVIDPAPFRQLRKYTRVELSKSVVAGREASLVDAGLALGRSFRVGWGNQGQVVHLGQLYNQPKPGKSDALAVDTLRLVSRPQVSGARSQHD